MMMMMIMMMMIIFRTSIGEQKINSLKEKSDHIGNLREDSGNRHPPGQVTLGSAKCCASVLLEAIHHHPVWYHPEPIQRWLRMAKAKAKAKGWWWECATDLCYENLESCFLGIEIHRNPWFVALGVALKPWDIPNWCCIQWFQESNALIVQS